MIARVADTGQEKITILVANVFQDNNDFAKLLALVELRDPDVIFLLETDQKWLKGVKSLKQTHPYFIEVPKDNTYGLLFYSKFPLHNVEVNYLIDKEIPSIVADVEFDDQQIRIYGLHPMPPVPQESEFSTSRDAEILLIGKEAKKHKGPCLVIGDLNDVAWSYSTTLFLKASGLLDPRRGRGVYSTFNANYKLLRWPLDHIFVSSHFRLISMNVEKHIGSDHFPICICLCVADKDESNKLTADQEDKKLVEEKIVAGLIDEPR
jgi:endonuclease/exonuclease/phosphatase (EEP) superfamily protein YafD